jgi:hypothetical protein
LFHYGALIASSGNIAKHSFSSVFFGGSPNLCFFFRWGSAGDVLVQLFMIYP